MAKLSTGDFTFNASFDVNAAKPLDTRMLVDDVASIDYPYKGLLVYEYKEGVSAKYKYYDGTQWKVLIDAGNGQIQPEQLPIGNGAGDLVILGQDGKISSDFLPSYVDDVLEGYYDSTNDTFYTTYENETYSGAIVGETSKVYVDLTTNKAYRWSGHTYIEISQTNELVLANPIVPSVKVGGIEAGAAHTLPAGTSIENILRQILSPTLYPTFTNPSATLAKSGNVTLFEVGSTNSITFTVSFNQGSISPAYGTSGKRSGAATSYQLNDGTSQASNTFSNVSVTSASEGNITYNATVNYGAGEQPKDSVGNNYDSPLAAGSVTTSNITFEFVHRIYKMKTTEVPLMSISGTSRTLELVLPSHSTSNPYSFDFPKAWLPNGKNSISEIKMKNENAQNPYGGADIKGYFDISETTHTDASGANVAYYRLSYNRPESAAANTFRIKW